MTSADIRRTIASVGYAKVIAVLGQQGAGAAIEAMANPEQADNLAKNFVSPDAQQMGSLSITAQTMSSKSVKRPRIHEIPKMRIYPRLGLALGYVDLEGAAALSKDPRVSEVLQAPELSLIRPVASKASDEAVDVSWGIKRLKVDELWKQGLDGKGVLVGHLDTGVDGDHPDLKGQIKAFAEFDFAGDIVKGAKANDSGEHGTHTAGTIVGRRGERGAFGVAPGAKLASGLVIEGGSVTDRILAGFEWLAEQECKIVSLSLGLRGYTPAFEVVITALRNLNILPIIAVGNESANSSRSPGNYVNVLSVGASDKDDQIAWFSSSERFKRTTEPLVPDLVGPGVDTLSCLPDGGYGMMSGTSMATPHIAGLAAILMQAKKNATADEVEQAILQSCVRPNSMDPDRANRGIPDGLVALDILLGGGASASKGKSAKASSNKVASKRSVKPKSSKKGPKTAD